MANVVITRQGLEDRLRFKLRDSELGETRIHEWLNDAIQKLTALVHFDELRSDELTITGDGVAQSFDLPADYQAMSWMRDPLTGYWLDEVTSRELVEEYLSVSTPVQPPCVYTVLGRIGTDESGLRRYMVKFDSIPADLYEIKFEHYKLHPSLDADGDVVQLPVSLGSMIVDAAMVEADAWSDSSQYSMHARELEKQIAALKRNYHKKPNLIRRIGGATGRGKPGRVQWPWNY